MASSNSVTIAKKNEAVPVKTIQKHSKQTTMKPLLLRSYFARKTVMQKLLLDIVAKPDAQKLKGAEIKALFYTGEMLNDIPINMLLKSICKGKAALIESWKVFSERKWAEIVATIQNSELVVLPIFGGNHWSVMILNLKTKFIIFCDSITMENGRTLHERAAFHLKRKIEDSLGTPIGFFKKPVHQQQDNVSCGVHVILNVESLLTGHNWDNPLPYGIDFFRHEYAEILLFGLDEEQLDPKIEYIPAELQERKTDDADDDIRVEMVRIGNDEPPGVLKEQKTQHEVNEVDDVIVIDDDEEQSRTVPNLEISVIVIDD